jgi:hypothetical protein
MSLSVDAANRLLDTLRSEHLSIQVHVGPPGPDGSLMVAKAKARQRIRFRPPSDGAMKSTVAITWAAVPADERWTHFSLWDMDRNHVGNGELVALTVRKGDDVDLDSVTVAVVSATSIP